MPFGILSGVPDVITHAKFYVNRLTGFSGVAPLIVPFPILSSELTYLLGLETGYPDSVVKTTDHRIIDDHAMYRQPTVMSRLQVATTSISGQ